MDEINPIKPIKIRDDLNKIIFLLETRRGDWKTEAKELANKIQSNMKNKLEIRNARFVFSALDDVFIAIATTPEDIDFYMYCANELKEVVGMLFNSPDNTVYSMRYNKRNRSRKVKRSVKRSRKVKKSAKRSRKVKKSVKLSMKTKRNVKRSPKRSRKVKKSIKRSRKAKKSVKLSMKTKRSPKRSRKAKKSIRRSRK